MEGNETRVASITSFREGTFFITRNGRSTRNTRNTFKFPPTPPATLDSATVKRLIATMNPSSTFHPSFRYAFGPDHAVYATNFTLISTKNAALKK